MVNLPRTEAALAELVANQPRGMGAHAHQQVSHARRGRVVGYTDFEPTKHLPTDITPFSLIGNALEIDQVRSIQPDRPLVANLILDFQSRNELPGITSAKNVLAKKLRRSLDEARRDPRDRLNIYTLGQLSAKTALRDYSRPLTGETDPEAVQAAVEALARRDLTVMVSDFEWFTFGEGHEGALKQGIAIKINHGFERELPAKHGIISLGGWKEVNTKKRGELARANEDLARRHEEVVTGLEAMGASVASVVTDSRFPQGIDTKTTDVAMAQAVRAKQK